MYRNLDGIMHVYIFIHFYDQGVRVLISAFFVIDNVFEKKNLRYLTI